MEKVVYLDVDGTILPHNKMLSNFTISIIKEIQEKGIGVVLATGRNFKEIQEISHQLEFAKYLNYAICENGAYVTPTDKLDVMFLKTIAKKDALGLYDFLEKENIYGMFSSYKSQDFAYSNRQDKTKNDATQKNIDKVIPKFRIKAIDDTLDWDAVSMIAFDVDKDKVENYENYFAKNFPGIETLVSRSAHRVKPLFMLSAKNITKASAIKNLNQKLNIKDENTYFFGDGVNDLPAITTFKNSFVPESAPDYVKVKATNIIGKVDEDGVAKKLQELFLI